MPGNNRNRRNNRNRKKRKRHNKYRKDTETQNRGIERRKQK